MKKCVQPLLLALIVGLLAVATAARADDQPQPPAPPPPTQKVVMGTLLRIEKTTLYLKNKAGEEIAVPTNSATEVYDDGERAALSSLSVGQKVKATMVNGVATKIQTGGKPKPKP